MTKKSFERSEIAKAPTGISGLDEITFGGLPAGRPTLVSGGPGSGKTLFGVSFLALPRSPHAAAAHERMPLWRYLAGASKATIPVPEIQIFGGGAHAARRVDVQDFMIVCPSAESFAQALDRTAEVYRAAGKLLAERGLLQGVADEGGYWPAFDSNEQALEMPDQALRLRQQIAVADYFGDDAPARALVEINPDPPARPNVRWAEEPVRILVKKQVLIYVRGFDPHTRSAAAVMIVSAGVHRKELVPQSKCRRAPRFNFVRFRQRKTNRP